VGIQLRLVLARHGERGRVDVYLSCRNPKALARLPGNPREQRRRVVVVQPVQRPPQAIVVQRLGGDARSEQVLHRIGREELRDQIQSAVAAAEDVQEHGHRGGPDTHLLLGRAG
jgi:hypothetical protein